MGATAFAYGKLFPSLRRAVREVWEDVRDLIAVFAFAASVIATGAAWPKVLLYFGFSPGDDLLCTAVLRELRRRGRGNLLMVSDHPELFADNDDPAAVRPLWRRYYRDRSTAAICRRFARITGGQFIRLEYAPPCGDDSSQPPARHIVAEMCAKTGITGPIEIRPYLTMSEPAKSSGAWASGIIAIQSSGMAAHHPIGNKQWPVERFQGVVDALNCEVEFVQLGAVTDPALQGVRDLRGATGILDAAAILYNARLYVGTVGFLMHLARAVECPSVIVFGGREAPWQSGYVCNLNLYSAVPCAPCWRWNSCDYDRKCLSNIAVADVVASIREMLIRPRGPLAVETLELGPAAR